MEVENKQAGALETVILITGDFTVAKELITSGGVMTSAFISTIVLTG